MSSENQMVTELSAGSEEEIKGDGHDECDTKGDPPRKESFRNIIAFYAFGSLIYTVYSVIISGAQDILTGTFIPTAAVLVTNVGPYFLMTLIAPYFIHKVPYVIRIVAIYCFFTSGLFIIVYSKEVYLKLIGICMTSLGAGTGEISFFTLTAYYEQVTVSAYSAGTGTGFIVGPLYYTGMTTWACISPNETMLIMAGFPLMYLLFYAIMDKKHCHTGKKSAVQNNDDAEMREVASEKPTVTWKEKFSAASQILPLVLYLFVAYVCEYVTIQAVITTMSFSNAPFPPRVHYRYYVFIFLGGEFVARSYLALIDFLKPNLVPTFAIHRIWILSLILLVHLGFLLSAAWYRFVHDVWIVFALIFTAGLTAGAAFANAFMVVSETAKPEYKEFAMGFATIGMGAGTFVAGVIGLLLEPLLREHCLLVSEVPENCFTRPFGGWNSTLTC